jgi:predicted metal-dependent hydrolase
VARIGYFELQDALTLAVIGAERLLETSKALFEKNELERASMMLQGVLSLRNLLGYIDYYTPWLLPKARKIIKEAEGLTQFEVVVL